jgi:hypothetical protein
MTKIVNKFTQDEYEQKRIMIYLTFSNFVVDKVCVCLYDPIAVLFQILPVGEKTIFYQGRMIQSYLTFENCGITDNDRIVILSTNQMTLTTEQFWRKATKRDFEDKEQMNMFQNPLLKNDFSRQQDIRFNRIENKGSSFRSLVRNFLFLTKETNETESGTYLNFEKKENPSESSFPTLW